MTKMKREQILRAIEGSVDAPTAFLKLLETHVIPNAYMHKTLQFTVLSFSRMLKKLSTWASSSRLYRGSSMGAYGAQCCCSRRTSYGGWREMRGQARKKRFDRFNIY